MHLGGLLRRGIALGHARDLARPRPNQLLHLGREPVVQLLDLRDRQDGGREFDRADEALDHLKGLQEALGERLPQMLSEVGHVRRVVAVERESVDGKTALPLPCVDPGLDLVHLDVVQGPVVAEVDGPAVVHARPELADRGRDREPRSRLLVDVLLAHVEERARRHQRREQVERRHRQPRILGRLRPPVH